MDVSIRRELERLLADHQGQIAGLTRSIAKAEREKLHPLTNTTVAEMDAAIARDQAAIAVQETFAHKIRVELGLVVEDPGNDDN